jgi:hypothetical protein
LVHSVGNPGGSGALWVYTPGKVRQVYQKNWRAEVDGKTLSFKAKVVETDSATNPGDSGGPLVNDQGELVGVTQGGAIKAQLLSTFVDVGEVKRILANPDVARYTKKKSTAPPIPERREALPSLDGAHFFGDAAWKALQATADDLYRRKKFDLVIETYETPPKGDLEKIKGMSPADRKAYYNDLVEERVRAKSIKGVYVLITKDPRAMMANATQDSPVAFPKGFGDTIYKALSGEFKNEKYDDGLRKVLDLVRDPSAGEKKK